MATTGLLRRINPWPYRLPRWLLGVIFVYSGITKLMAPEIFAVLIDAYGILPEPLVLPVAVMLPTVEVLAGAGLIVDLRGSLAVIAGMLLLFMAILGYGISMGLDVDCGCFGPEDPESKAFHGLRAALYRDVAMLAGGVFLYAWRRLQRIEPLRMAQLFNTCMKRKREDAYV
jgi:uncharacterized membrane protein YphA (DoxX/SURF4 family)